MVFKCKCLIRSRIYFSFSSCCNRNFSNHKIYLFMYCVFLVFTSFDYIHELNVMNHLFFASFSSVILNIAVFVFFYLLTNSYTILIN